MGGITLGLGGYAFSGKDTVADCLEAEYGWVKTYMSKPLETALLRVNPWVDTRRNNWETERPGILGDADWLRYDALHGLVGYDASKKCLDVRNYLQKLGTEVGRQMFGENVWVDYAFSNADKLTADGLNVAVTGIRFHNELDAVSQRPRGINVWVERPGYGPVNAHASDNTLGAEDFDVIIHNDSTLEHLYGMVAELVTIC